MAVEAGTRLGRFVVREYIGQGTLGIVYRADDPEVGAVAVKVLHRLADPESRDRFQEAAPRLLAVRHPGLVAALERGEHDEVPYLVQEHADAVTLAERFRRATMNPSAVMAILRGMAAAIDHAHAEGLVHGNLKPAQVLLTAGDRALVSDFGLAPLRRPRLAGLAVGFRDGTPEYLAPEQVVGGEPTAATDRYAFAAIAYQLLVDRGRSHGPPHRLVRAVRGRPAVGHERAPADRAGAAVPPQPGAPAGGGRGAAARPGQGPAGPLAGVRGAGGRAGPGARPRARAAIRAPGATAVLALAADRRRGRRGRGRRGRVGVRRRRPRPRSRARERGAGGGRRPVPGPLGPRDGAPWRHIAHTIAGEWSIRRHFAGLLSTTGASSSVLNVCCR